MPNQSKTNYFFLLSKSSHYIFLVQYHFYKDSASVWGFLKHTKNEAIDSFLNASRRVCLRDFLVCRVWRHKRARKWRTSEWMQMVTLVIAYFKNSFKLNEDWMMFKCCLNALCCVSITSVWSWSHDDCRVIWPMHKMLIVPSPTAGRSQMLLCVIVFCVHCERVSGNVQYFS